MSTSGWLVRALCAVGIAALLAAPGASAQEILINPSFEDEIGAEWTFFGTTDFDQFSGWFGVDAQDGDWFIGAAIDGGTKTGGVYQEVEVTSGSSYLLTSWVNSWKRDLPKTAPECRIGVDLTGGVDPEAETVTWSEGLYTDGAWAQVGIFFEATGASATVFLQMVQKDSTFNITALDNASLTELQPGTVSGTVTDGDTSPLEGALVVTDPYNLSTLTAADGTYSLGVPADTYDLTASKVGFDPATAFGVVVAAAGSVTQDFVLPEQTCEGFEFGNGGFETAAFPPWLTYGSIGNDFPGPGAWMGGITPYEGDKFQGTARNGSAAGTFGMYQFVCVSAGAEVTATAQSALYWGTNAPQTPDSTRNRIGIDPAGGDNPGGETVVWSEWDTQAEGWTWAWHEMTVSATALGPKITVFLEGRQGNDGGDQWHLNCFDAATLEVSGAVEPDITMTSIEKLDASTVRVLFENTGDAASAYGAATADAPDGLFTDEPAAVVTDLGGGVIQVDVPMGAADQQFIKGSATP